MARIRSIKPAFFLNEDVATLAFEWRLLFIGIWTQADRAGRLEDRPLRLKAALFPYDSVDIEDGLRRLADAGLIVRYAVGDKRYIAVPTWEKHQQPHVREADSELPPPEHMTSTVPASGQHPGSGSGNGSGKGVDQVDSSAPHAATEPAEPALLVFPTVGKSGKEWALAAAQVAEWRGLFPGLDILAECRKAKAWVAANPDRKKTPRGMPAFLVNWFTRTVNRGGVSDRRPAPSHRPEQRPARVHWTVECHEVHGGTCAKGWDHGERMKLERGEVA